ncbi:MAG TPA: nuclear transport factor 2 family protein [Acidimicrobiales bacterium]
MRAADELALRRLAALYARAADRNEPETFAGVFLPDARLRVWRPADTDAPSTDVAGHEALGRIPGRLASRYARTFHFLGQSTYEIGDDEATGEVYCLAHHLAADAEDPSAGAPAQTTDYVMHMRYLDTYRRDSAGGWRIAERTAYVDWTESRPADPLAPRP